MPSKQTKQDSFEKQNGVKDDTDVSNDSAVVKRGDNVNYTGDDVGHVVIKSEEMDVVVKAEPEELEEEEESDFNPELILSIDDIKTDEDYNYDGVDPLNTQVTCGKT